MTMNQQSEELVKQSHWLRLLIVIALFVQPITAFVYISPVVLSERNELIEQNGLRSSASSTGSNDSSWYSVWLIYWLKVRAYTFCFLEEYVYVYVFQHT